MRRNKTGLAMTKSLSAIRLLYRYLFIVSFLAGHFVLAAQQVPAPAEIHPLRDGPHGWKLSPHFSQSQHGTSLWTGHCFKSEMRSRKSEWGIKWALDTKFSAFRLPNSDFNTRPSKARHGNNTGKNERILIAGNDIAALRERIKALGLAGRVQQEQPEANALLLWLSQEEVQRFILPLEEVVFIDRRNKMPVEERAVRGFDLSVNKVNALHARYPELRGAGQVVSVKEDRFDSTDIDFRGRVLSSSLASNIQSPHATTMASMIAGGGNTFYTGKGVAWGAALSSSSFLNVFPDDPAYFQSSGIGVQNHSYGLDIENYYGAEAMAYDRQVYENPTLVHIFSAGNRGDSASQAGPYAGLPGFANLTGNFKMAKNVLTVGPVDSLIQVASRGSRGPAYDGRVKPELVAFGEDGSSGAAAVVSGLAALLQEAYKKLNDNDSLPAALLRAVLLNSADDIGPPGPDYFSGYGNVNALEAVETIQEGRFFRGSLAPGITESFTIQAPDNALNLKVTLAWTDPPASVNAATALVNDLDLILRRENEQWRPWVLSTFPHSDSLSLPARRGADYLNNQEQVALANPAGGAYEIEVSAANLPQGPQEFFVAWQWDTGGHFQWIFPVHLDNATSGQRVPVRWETTVEGPAVLEYRLAGAGEWTIISDEAALEDDYFYWEVPNTYSLAQLRMNTGGSLILSDTFTISAPPEMELALECADSLLLNWNGHADADSFQVYALDGPYLEPLEIVQDTFIVIDKKQDPSRFYAVAPFIGSPPMPGERSFALNLDFQFAGCYIQNFLANLMGEEVELILSLGASYRVDSLIFEKEKNGEFRVLAANSSNGTLEASYVDRGLEEGLNTYRAVVALNNGTRLNSEPVSVLFTRAAFLIYPNPVPAGQEGNIRSKETQEAHLFLYDALGRLLLELPLASGFEAIPTQNLAVGVYHYQIAVKGERRAEGKLLIW